MTSELVPCGEGASEEWREYEYEYEYGILFYFVWHKSFVMLKISFPFIIFSIPKVFHELGRGITDMERHWRVWIVFRQFFRCVHSISNFS